MTYRKLGLFSFILYFLLLSDLVYSQKTQIYTTYNKDFQKGIELFDAKKYVPAQKYFERAIKEFGNDNPTIRTEAQYFHALCAVELYNKDAEYLISKFIEENQGSTRVKDAYFHMARFYYRTEKYKQAVIWFDTIDRFYLNPEELSEISFKQGFSYFKTDDYENARIQFYDIINKETKYTVPAIYYYSHIAYEQKNFQTSLNGFNKIKDDPTFKTIAPYYIIQIYNIQKKYDDILTYAVPLIDSLSEKRKPEIARIIGEAYYQKAKYDSSLKYLQIYTGANKKLTQQDNYRLAYVYYRLKRFNDAISYFEIVSNDSSEMSQNALYHLADCYIHTGQKEKARLAFSSSASFDFNQQIKRDALFNYAMVTYELSYQPFNEAITAFTSFIEKYPESEKVEIAFQFLVMAYLNTRNYKDALESINKIKNRNEDMDAAFQRISFFRGLELFNNLNIDEAISLFEQSLKFSSFDHLIKAKSYFWYAEALFRKERYTEAIDYYSRFIESLGAFEMPEYNEALYGLGYANFNTLNYSKSGEYFRKYTTALNDQKNKKVADAYNRIGDCYFVATSYIVAIDFYAKSVSYNLIDADYALFQKGICLGLLGKHDEKIKILRKLNKDFNQSAFNDDALYEMGLSFVELTNLDSAIFKYKSLINKYPESSYASKSLVQLGLVYYNLDKNDQAMTYYKEVVDKYKGSEEEKNALGGIKNIYIENNNVDEFFNYVKGVKNYKDITDSEKDSLKYITAQNNYMKGDFETSLRLFSNYISEYPNGSFALNANYYLADCYFRNKDFDKAIESYQYVIDKPKNIFTEDALVNSGKVYFQKNEYKKAADIYMQLEKDAEIQENVMVSMIYQMKCYYELKDKENFISIATKLLDDEKTSQEIRRETKFKLGKIYFENNELDKALIELIYVSQEVKSKEGAESKYLVCAILLSQSKLKEAKKEVFEFIDMNSPHRFWLAKSFIILADVFVAENDDFQAIHTLKSLMENYENKTDGIIKETNDKYQQLVSKQQQDKPVNDTIQ